MVAPRYDLPDDLGHFGPYGGIFVAETLIPALEELKDAYALAQRDLRLPVHRQAQVDHLVALQGEVAVAEAADQLRGVLDVAVRQALVDRWQPHVATAAKTPAAVPPETSLPDPQPVEPGVVER